MRPVPLGTSLLYSICSPDERMENGTIWFIFGTYNKTRKNYKS